MNRPRAQPPSPIDDILPVPTLDKWLGSPELSFSIWIDHQAPKPSTRIVKMAMWKNFLKWMKGHEHTLASITFENLNSFLKEEKIIKAHRSRYLRMIERVYVLLIDLGLPMRENPGSLALKGRDKTWINDRTVFLEREEKEKIEKVIQERLRMYGGAEKKIEKEGKGRKKQTWLLIRDAAIAAVMLCGGATVGALSSLSVNCTNCTEGRIALPKEGGGTYESVLLPLGDTAITAWKRLRRHRVGIGDQLFPADLKSRGDNEVDTAGMHPSTIFRAVRSVLRDAGITGKRACGATLRNTYAGQLIDLGFDDLAIQEMMGFKEPLSAVRLRTAYLEGSDEESEAIEASIKERYAVA